MAKQKKTFDKLQWIEAYKAYVLAKGDLPAKAMDLVEENKLTFQELFAHFKTLEELETAVIARYLKDAHDLLVADDQFYKHSDQEKQLAFIYILIEKVGTDEAFLYLFHQHKKWDKAFAMRLMKMLGEQEIAWGTSMQWESSPLARFGTNPKRIVLINHALSAVAFFLNDNSDDKQDTDAYIEKSTDLLYRLTDTKTLRSMVDFGKFMVTRKKAAFSWD